MSNRKGDKIKEAYRNMKMFFDILQNKGEKYLQTGSDDDLEELKEILKMQHQSNRYFLEDLGLKFDETGVIRSLNQKIESLEKQLEEKVENSPAIITQYISNLGDELRDHFLSEFGVESSVDIDINKSMKVKLSLFRIERELTSTDKMFAQTDEELENRKLKNEQNYQKAIESLDLMESSYNKDLRMVYTKNNKIKIEDFLNRTMGDFGILANMEFGLRTEMKKNPEDPDVYIITSVSFIVIASAKMQSFHEVFNNR